MKEIPLLCSTPVVQAMLEGRKSQTRRVVKWPTVPDWHHPDYDPCTMVKPNGGVWWPHFRRFGFNSKRSVDETGAVKCPYGQPGDLLWVRETWAPDLAGHDVNDYVEYIRYMADGTRLPIKWVKDYSSYRNRPGIHMNKEYARIWLQVTDVRVERLKSITDDDAIAEGIESYHMIGDLIAYKNYSEIARKDFLNKSSYGFDSGKETQSAPVASFCSLWVDINGRESWISNPWVWVVNFKVLSTTGKPDLNNQ